MDLELRHVCDLTTNCILSARRQVLGRINLTIDSVLS